MRLQVFLSKAGVSSRRAAAGIIKRGNVWVNGKKILEPSFKINSEKDAVLLNNKKILPRKKIYILLHKPKGVTTTKKDLHAARIVMDLLPREYRHLNPVGRLDKDTTGLMLLTNDGELVNRLTHPKFNIEKTYILRLDKRLARAHKVRLEKGILLEGRRTRPCRIKLLVGDGLEVTLQEGRKRQIRRMFLKLGYNVMALERIKEGGLYLGALPEGKWRFLREEERSVL